MFTQFYIFTIFILTTWAQQWQSPCPSLFRYDPAGVQGDSWSGDITLVTETELSGIWMRVVLDRPPIEVITDFGEVVQRESDEYLVRRPGFPLKPGQTQNIHLTVKFNTLEPPPQLVGFRLNARVVCPENGVLEKTTPSPVAAVPAAPTLQSPCPDVFTYEPLNETNKWFGTMQLKTDKELTGLWIRVILDQNSNQLGVSDEFLQNWFGEVTTADNKEYLIKKPGYKLLPGSTVAVRFFIKYNPDKPIPQVVGIRLNDSPICQGNVIIVPNGQTGPSQGFVPQNRPPPTQNIGGDQFITPPSTGGQDGDSDYYHNDFAPGSKPIFSQGVSGQCGTVVAQPRPLITHGQTTEEGEWPWHAALYRTRFTEQKYICGGSLISLSHVITVAHCVTRVRSSTPVNPETLLVFLGKYYLTKYNPGKQEFVAQNIFVHNQYDFRTFKNDIAIIKLNVPARFSDRVRPVCLWSETVDINSVIGRIGTVVGWGFDETGIVTENLYKANMPVVAAETCIYSYPEFFSRFTNEKTYCAGFKNSSSVCNGDSGGGMVFPKITQRNVWQLRGLVSIGVALQQQTVCDTKHYAVFTDIAKYLDWINQVLKL